MTSNRIQVGLVIKRSTLSDIIKNELNSIEEINLVCYVHNKDEMIKSLKTKHIDLLLLSASLDSESDFQCSAYIKENGSHIGTLALSIGDDSIFIREMIKNGVSGFIQKNAPSSRLAEAINVIVNGGKYYDPHMNQMGNDINNVNQLERKKTHKPSIKLNIREQLIMRFLIDDYTESQIAKKLVLTNNEVRAMIDRLMKKTNSNSTVDLFKYANEYDLVRN